MKKIIITLLLSISPYGIAGVHIDKYQSKIVVSGVIAENDDVLFKKAVKELQSRDIDIKEVLINSSPGGNTKAGLNIGLEILTLKADIVLTGWCFSSCANYIFASGNTKYLKPGTLTSPTVVGFHGSPTATLSYFMNKGYSKTEISDFLLRGVKSTNARKFLNYVFDNESKFFKRLGVNEHIFNISVRPETRSAFLDCPGGEVPRFFTPDTNQLEDFGFSNIVGNVELFVDHGDKDIVYCNLL